MMENAKLYDRQVFYDTSTYVALSEPTLEDLIVAEKRDRIEAVAHPVVVSELLHKLASFDTEDPVFKRGRAGLIRLYRHTFDGVCIPLVLTMERRLYVELFGMNVPSAMPLEYFRTVAEVVKYANRPEIWSSQTKQTIAGARGVKDDIQAFHDWLRDLCVDSRERGQNGEAGADVFIPHIVAGKLASDAANNLNIEVTNEQHNQHIDLIVEHYPIGVFFGAESMAKLFDNAEGDVNNLWDEMIMYGLRKTPWLDELPSVFVTNEPKHWKLAIQYSPDAVRKLTDYYADRQVTPTPSPHRKEKP